MAAHPHSRKDPLRPAQSAISVEVIKLQDVAARDDTVSRSTRKEKPTRPRGPLPLYKTGQVAERHCLSRQIVVDEQR